MVEIVVSLTMTTTEPTSTGFQCFHPYNNYSGGILKMLLFSVGNTTSNFLIILTQYF